jgi:NAD(P)-dependent dehydrogenase (short-subunit alcohol dehydrogenase family)
MAPKVWLSKAICSITRSRAVLIIVLAVTGTSSGIGRAVTEAALERGDIVVATARKPETLSDLKSTYPASRLLILKLDVLKDEDVKAAFVTASEHFKRIDVVYSNSGYGLLGEFEFTPEEKARAMFDVNVWGAGKVSREAIRVFRDVNKPMGGQLITASSSATLFGAPGLAWYTAASVTHSFFSSID